MGILDSNVPILKGIRWHKLAVLFGLVSAFAFYVLTILSRVEQLTALTFLSVFFIGMVLAVSGGLLTLRARYELFPGVTQTIGACILGAVGAYILVVSLYILRVASVEALILLVFMHALALIPSVIGTKIARHKKLTLPQVMGALIVIVGVYAFFSFSIEAVVGSQVVLLALSIPVAAIVAEIVVRMFNTAVLSPWVNSFWAGLTMAVGSILLAPSFVQLELLNVSRLLNMPLWIGLTILLLGVAIIITRLLLQKLRMAGGYMAYKQSLALVALLLGVFVIAKVVYGIDILRFELLGVVLFFVGYLTIEDRLLTLIGLKK